MPVEDVDEFCVSKESRKKRSDLEIKYIAMGCSALKIMVLMERARRRGKF